MMCPKCKKLIMPSTEELDKIIKKALQRLKDECNFGVRPFKRERE
jgi:hypothetical protein